VGSAQIRWDNERLEEEAARARRERAEVEGEIGQARRQLEALAIQKQQGIEDLDRIKREKVELKELAAKKKEVEGT
jgi:chromosome segregation ATPase